MNECNQPSPTMILFLVLTALISSAASAAMNEGILTATQEMQKANYFTFVMLLNMAPPNTFQGNVTFLMPNDRSLANTTIPGATVLDFLLRHSIPSPLLVDHLEHFPTGSMIPASKPGFMFEVTNDGRRRFNLSNVRIISPNICTRASSVRCHGIDGVVKPTMLPRPNMPPTPTCAAPAVPSTPSSMPPEAEHVPVVIAAPPPKVNSHHKSSSCRLKAVDLLTLSMAMLIIFIN